MRKTFVVNDFIELPVPHKIEFGRHVVALMTGNEYFNTPDVPLATLTSQTNKLEADYNAAQGGDHRYVAQMRQSETELNNTLRKMADYVNRIADGSEVIILSAGFNVSKQPVASQRPELIAESGKKTGEVTLTRKTVAKARAYTWQYAVGNLPANDKDWLFAGTSTKATYTVTDLEPATKCWFRVSAVTPEGMGEWTTPVMKVVE